MFDMVIGEEALGALTGDFVDGVDEEDSPLLFLRLGRAADDHTGFHRRVVNELRPQSEDGLANIGFDELAPHVSLLLAEKYAMRKEDGTAAGPGRQALQNVLPEGIVGTSLRRGTIDVAAPEVRSESVAVPLFDGVGRIRQH